MPEGEKSLNKQRHKSGNPRRRRRMQQYLVTYSVRHPKTLGEPQATVQAFYSTTSTGLMYLRILTYRPTIIVKFKYHTAKTKVSIELL